MLTIKQVAPITFSLALALSMALPTPGLANKKAELDAQWRLWRSTFGARRSAEAHRIRWMNGVDGHCGELVDGVIVKRNPLTCRGWHPPRLEVRNGSCLEIAPGEIIVASPPQAVCTAHFAATFRWEGSDCTQWVDGALRGVTPELDLCRRAFPTTFVPDHQLCMEVTPAGAFIGYAIHDCSATALRDVFLNEDVFGRRTRDVASPACTADLGDAKFIVPPELVRPRSSETRGSSEVPL